MVNIYLNRRGWLRIVEAIVAILIVFGAVLTVVTTRSSSVSSDPCAAISPLLDEISQNFTLRNQILNNEITDTEIFLANHIRNPNLDIVVKICSPEQALCSHERNGVEKADVCAQERLIAGSTESPEFKKLKVFIFKI